MKLDNHIAPPSPSKVTQQRREMPLLTAHAFGGSAILVRPTEMHRDDLSTEAARGEIQRTVKNDISFHGPGTRGESREGYAFRLRDADLSS